MTKDYTISIYLDTRREKLNGKYPVKLRVFIPSIKKQKLYSTAFDLTHEEYKSIWESTKPRKEHKEVRMKLRAIETHASEVAEKLSYFSFESFETFLFKGTTINQGDVVSMYNLAIEQYKRNKQIGTASSYDLSLKSLLEFHKKDSLYFYTITPQWLKDYESYMTEVKNRSKTTVGIYLRPLRAIFNTALANQVLTIEQYPFGRRKYSIPSPKGTKKALSKDQLKLLFESEPSTPEQKKAKAFWFFSYSCNGMNFKDIAYLQYQDISGDTLLFRRAKTANTNKTQAPVIVYLNDFTKLVIEQYGNPKRLPNEYIFPIVEHSADYDKMHTQLKNFIRFINQHFEKFANGLGISEKVSTYWARHSFATSAIRNGASMEYVSEALSHSNLKTTQSYFAGFEDDRKKEISEKMMQF